MDAGQHGSQLSFDLVSRKERRAPFGGGDVVIAPDGRVIDEAEIKAAVARARARLAEQALRRARRLDQVRLWRAYG
jgi:hypothetical protein